MNVSQIHDSLKKIFKSDGYRIVCCFEPGAEVRGDLDDIELKDIVLLRLDQKAALEIKQVVELEDSMGQYLIYSPTEEPEPTDDWLLDVRLYSHTFYADRASIILNELGLTNLSLRQHISKNLKFFKSQDRVSRLVRWVRPEDGEQELELKILAVLAGAAQPDAFSILMSLYSGMPDGTDTKLFPQHWEWEEIEKYHLESAFWNLMKRTFGYSFENPNLQDFLIRLLVTDLAQGLTCELPESFNHLKLPKSKQAINASVFLAQWRSNLTRYHRYNALSAMIASEIKAEERMQELDVSCLVDAMTFEIVERTIIRSLRDELSQPGAMIHLEEITGIIEKRRSGHWVYGFPVAKDGSESNYSTIYDALQSAAELLDLRQAHEDSLNYSNLRDAYVAYEQDLYRFDQLYRLFHEAADKVELEGKDILKGLRTVVEDCYSGWFIDRLSLAWTENVVSKDSPGEISNWGVESRNRQDDFYGIHVEPALKTYPQGKVYVVISDAFRYEAARELEDLLNSKNRFDANLQSQLAVLPSYTSLGMAALLPHEKMGIKDGANLEVLVDEQPASSTDQRGKILAGKDGGSVKYESLMELSRDEGRAFVKPFRLLYVYHNQIDAVGDSASTEQNTFRAVRTAIEELAAVVGFIINNLNGSMVIITSDHGFLYQELSPGDLEKSTLKDKPSGTIQAKKRYLMGRNLGKGTKVLHGYLSDTADIEGDMEFWIPKGVNRFHFVGGAKFIHGGAMPQEVVLPVLTVRAPRGKAREEVAVRKVNVSLLGSVRKIVNNIQRFEFIQVEAASDKVRGRILTVSLRDSEELISNEVTLNFDSKSSSMDDRKLSAKIILKSQQFDKQREYSLVLRDPDTQVEFERTPVTIDLAFTSDF